VLLDPELRVPFAQEGMTLVRPDGYVACSASSVSVIAEYLDNLRGSPMGRKPVPAVSG
jgi:hypothetical protein